MINSIYRCGPDLLWYRGGFRWSTWSNHLQCWVLSGWDGLVAPFTYQLVAKNVVFK